MLAPAEPVPPASPFILKLWFPPWLASNRNSPASPEPGVGWFASAGVPHVAVVVVTVTAVVEKSAAARCRADIASCRRCRLCMLPANATSPHAFVVDMRCCCKLLKHQSQRVVRITTGSGKSPCTPAASSPRSPHGTYVARSSTPAPSMCRLTLYQCAAAFPEYSPHPSSVHSKHHPSHYHMFCSHSLIFLSMSPFLPPLSNLTFFLLVKS